MTPKTNEINTLLLDKYLPAMVENMKVEKLENQGEILEYMQAVLREVLKKKDELAAECERQMVGMN